MKPPFTYFGGKLSLAERIAAMLPEHEHYVEPFFGSGAVLLAKPRSRMETVNDLAGDIVHFWKTLRDHPAELERACFLTPHSREEHQLSYKPAEDGIERARRTWVRLTQGRAGQLRQRTGWRYYQDPRGSSASMPGYVAAYAGRVGAAAQRMFGVSIECLPALDLVARYGRHDGVLLYCDPPYLDSTRTNALHGDVYVHEMRDEASHRELARALLDARAAVVLSGYDSPLYADLYAGWYRSELRSFSGNSRVTARTEVLWSNRPFPQASLFDFESACG